MVSLGDTLQTLGNDHHSVSDEMESPLTKGQAPGPNLDSWSVVAPGFELRQSTSWAHTPPHGLGSQQSSGEVGLGATSALGLLTSGADGASQVQSLLGHWKSRWEFGGDPGADAARAYSTLLSVEALLMGDNLEGESRGKKRESWGKLSLPAYRCDVGSSDDPDPG